MSNISIDETRDMSRGNIDFLFLYIVKTSKTSTSAFNSTRFCQITIISYSSKLQPKIHKIKTFFMSVDKNNIKILKKRCVAHPSTINFLASTFFAVFRKHKKFSISKAKKKNWFISSWNFLLCRNKSR